MTSELKPDLSSFGYADGGYMSKCSHCKETFIGAKRAWSCKPCAIMKSSEPMNTRAVPDVPELVTVGHLWEYAEYYRDDRGYYGYVKIITEENPSTHVSPASKIRHHRELVTRDQAAEIIAAKDKEIYQLICALSACQKALNSLISEESIKNTTVINAYAMCVDAELKARKALKGESNV